MTEGSKPEGGHPNSRTPQALSRAIHFGIPVASFLVILAFAVVIFQPANRSTLPAESTLIFIPVYLVIVVTLVFGSMYLFKRLMDTEDATYTGN